jgi:hypothetical protein
VYNSSSYLRLARNQRCPQFAGATSMTRTLLKAA